MRKEIQDWARISATPARDELEKMYRDIVCPSCGPLAVMALDDRSMIKGICVAVFMAYCDRLAKWRIIKYLSEAFGINEWTIRRFLPTRSAVYVNIEVRDKGGRALGVFDTVSDVAAATGVSAPEIHKAIYRGGSAGGYYFSYDTAKPSF